jgi:phosphate transport system substrate-binding protein
MKRVLIALTGAAVLLAACGGATGSTNPSASGPVPPAASLTGTGATFPKPFYDAAFFAYHDRFSQVTVNYNALGSGAGIQQLTAKTVDFGASDVPMSASELDKAGGSDKVVQIATTLGTISLAYNLDGVSNGQLKLTPDTIAGIFLGKIKKWNDAALAADNSGVSLPNTAITVVHRSEGSGTTYIFSDYLSSVSDEWKTRVGKGKSLSWPVGQGAQGNAAVATTIKQTSGAIGYVELAYVIQTGMTQAKLKNKDGSFVLPSEAAATSAAKNSPAVTPSQFSIVNAPGKDSAPITGYSWVMLYKQQDNKTKGTAVVDLLYWLLTDGQQFAANVHYAKLPANMVSDDINSLKSVSSGGSALLTVPSNS